MKEQKEKGRVNEIPCCDVTLSLQYAVFFRVGLGTMNETTPIGLFDFNQKRIDGESSWI